MVLISFLYMTQTLTRKQLLAGTLLTPPLLTPLTPAAAAPSFGYQVRDRGAEHNLYTRNTPLNTLQEDLSSTLKTIQGTYHQSVPTPIPVRGEYTCVRATINSGVKYADHHDRFVGYGWGKHVYTVAFNTRTLHQLGVTEVGVFTTTPWDPFTYTAAQAAWAGVITGTHVICVMKTTPWHSMGTWVNPHYAAALTYEDVWSEPNRRILPNEWVRRWGDDFSTIEYWYH